MSTLNLVERAFNVGDLVRLKSGSPRLVVTGHTYSGVKVEWIGVDRHLPQAAVYPASCLVIDPPEQQTKYLSRY